MLSQSFARSLSIEKIFLSNSTAITSITRADISKVNWPSPGPISRAVSFFPRPAASSNLFFILPSIRKFWPRRFCGRKLNFFSSDLISFFDSIALSVGNHKSRCLYGCLHGIWVRFSFSGDIKSCAMIRRGSNKG